MEKLDKLDWKILEILDWHGREPVSSIAKRVKANKDVVTYRIKKLEEAGIIVRYYPVLDMHKLGYYTYRLYFELEEMDENKEKEFIHFLDKEINAGLIFRMDYPYRYGILLWTESIYNIEKIIIKIKRKLGKALLSYNHSIFCTFRVYPKDYLFDKEYHTTYRSLEPQEKVPYDKNDYQIAKELAKNARVSTVEVAKNLNIPQTTVSNKIKNLEKRGIIMGYRAEIDFIKLGYMNYFMEIYLETNENLPQIEAWVNSHKNTVWLQKIIGTCDIEVEVEVKDRVAFEALLNELREKFKNIRKIIFWSQEYKKMTFLP